MKINHESEIDAASAKKMREHLGLSRNGFWAAICVTPASGRAYEEGRVKIPPYIKRLFFLHYGLNFPTDITAGAFESIPDKDFVPNLLRSQILEAGLRAAAESIKKTLKEANRGISK